MQLLSFDDFMVKNEDWIQGREWLGQEAYKNYCDVATRYKEECVELQDLIRELQNAKDKKVLVSYVMTIECSNFCYIGNDLDLSTMCYVEATECLHIYTTSGNELIVPETYDIEKHEGIEAFSNSIEYIVREEAFTIGFLFHYE